MAAVRWMTKYGVENVIGHDEWEGRGWTRDLRTDTRWLELWANGAKCPKYLTNKGTIGRLSKPRTKHVGGLKKMGNPKTKRFMLWW